MKDQLLYAACEKTQQDFVALWERLVNIDTGTGYGEGINQVVAIVAEQLKALGASIEIIPVEDATGGSHVVGTFEGQGKGKILAMAHMDTVFPVGTVAKRPFRIQDDWVYGPGVSDCKGSIVLFLSAMKQLKNLKYHDYGKITCLFNCDEETTSPHSRHIIKKLAHEHDYVLCMESGQVGDGVVMWRKGSAQMQLEVFGKTSHAGSNPENGRNAIMEILHQIQQLSTLENPEKLTTLNFTTIKSGDRVNVIPDYAMAQADIRTLYPEELDRIEVAAEKIAEQKAIPDTTVKVSITRGNPPFSKNPGTDDLVRLAQEIYSELGKKLIAVGAGGASDANWAASAGAIAIDGLGPVKGGKNHTEHECTKLDSVVPRMYLLTKMLMRLGAGK
ncbi:glutamate carboxypeptidase [Sporomusaceae bacterium BoRhaA]|uniref:glutamate carboxypeptidase n=1 Tax=Pelorhabdus rhamnosifermentans TaxID=2772457 RepID=UPI001C05F6F3|nr:glutamate carboxypeptidase [Pelorhabdus rhamnosifermentans]MBU2699453.1 glutamate carboxypeptidase [Pelorhabdus rhamnosifermentans]